MRKYHPTELQNTTANSSKFARHVWCCQALAPRLSQKNLSNVTSALVPFYGGKIVLFHLEQNSHRFFQSKGKRLCFRGALVWRIGLTVEILMLRFLISPALCGMSLKHLLVNNCKTEGRAIESATCPLLWFYGYNSASEIWRYEVTLHCSTAWMATGGLGYYSTESLRTFCSDADRNCDNLSTFVKNTRYTPWLGLETWPFDPEPHTTPRESPLKARQNKSTINTCLTIRVGYMLVINLFKMCRGQAGYP